MAKLRFLRAEPLVAVRPIRLGPELRLLPGDALPDGTRLFQKRSLFRRNLVGVVGCPWTEAQLARRGVVPVESFPPPESEALPIAVSEFDYTPDEDG